MKIPDRQLFPPQPRLQSRSKCPKFRPVCRNAFDVVASMGRGAFIVLEGLDRSGKTTQTAKLVQRIQDEGNECKLIKFPGTANPVYVFRDA